MIQIAVGFLGAGNMAEALIRGLLETRTCTPARIFASDVNAERLAGMAGTYGIQTCSDNQALARACDVLVLAVKPQQAAEALSGLRSALEPARHVLVSIAAGVTTSYLEKASGLPLKVVRVMPNTPAKLRAGAAAFCLGRYAGPAEERLASELFSAVGLAVPTQESLMNAVTALSGSGPAYVFRLCEVMTAAGVELGLPPQTAEQLTVQTILGSARMLAESGQKATELRQAVTSKAGTTEAALKSLDAAGIEAMFKTALRAAGDRARELTPPDPER